MRGMVQSAAIARKPEISHPATECFFIMGEGMRSVLFVEEPWISIQLIVQLRKKRWRTAGLEAFQMAYLERFNKPFRVISII